MIIVCDCHYRSSICAIRSFHDLGEKVIAVTTSDHKNPPSFSSRYVNKRVILSSDPTKYKEELLEICKEYDKPIIFPTGNFTLNILSKNKDEFSEFSSFCVSNQEMLCQLNDKKWVKEKAKAFGIKVPCRYSIDAVPSFPVVIKPFCGETFSLKASERYTIVNNNSELLCAYEYFKQYDADPIIEEYVPGYGVGVSVLLDNNSKLQTFFSHKRITEYPTDGGPSSLLKTIYDKETIDKVRIFFESIGFCGIAMAEFKCNDKGMYLLEVNPRVWGSFPATIGARSDFVAAYLYSSRNMQAKTAGQYKVGKRIKFTRGLSASTMSYFKQFNLKKGLVSLFNLLNPFVCDPIFSIKDPAPFFKELFRRSL